MKFIKKYKRFLLVENNIVGILNIVCEYGGYVY